MKQSKKWEPEKYSEVKKKAKQLTEFQTKQNGAIQCQTSSDELDELEPRRSPFTCGWTCFSDDEWTGDFSLSESLLTDNFLVGSSTIFCDDLRMTFGWLLRMV